jgi:hypothetical protein
MAKSSSPRTTKSNKASSGKRLERKHHMSGAFLGTIAVGVLSIIASFGLGIRSAGEIKTVQNTEAAAETANLTQRARGDINANGLLEIRDAILMEERILGLAQVTRQEILDGDMNGDFKLTGQDLLALLHAIADR